MTIPALPQQKPVHEIENWNLDRTVEPYVAVRGMMGKDASGTWQYLSVSSSGALRNDDAANFRVSAFTAESVGGSLATNQVSIASAAATVIVNVNTNRTEGVLIVNHSSENVYLGSSAVTSGTGILLRGVAGTAVTLPTTSAVYGIVSSTGQTVSYIEI